MNVAEAVAALGVGDTDDGVLVFARKTKDGRMRHYGLREIGGREIGNDLYRSTALFAPGSVTEFSGRSEENIVRILWLPFDFDLVTFSGIPKEQLYELPDEAITPWINALVERVDTIFEHLGLVLHRIDYTGYGIAGYLNVPPHERDAVPRIRALHKAIVAQVNAVAREPLADKQVSDAGTRIMRLVPTLNTKNPERPRLTRNIRTIDGEVTEDQLVRAAGEIPPPTRIVPETGSLLDEETTAKIIEAVRPHWVEGNRHGVALALGALLAKAGVPEDQTMGIVFALAAGDDEERDRRVAVHTSYERVRTGLPVRGFYGLQDFLPMEVVGWLDGIASRVREANVPRLTIGGRENRPPEPRNFQIDQRFVEPPNSAFVGLVKNYVDIVSPCSESPDAFHLGVILTGFGQMLGRHVHMVYASDPLYANLYTLLVGRSNKTKKDSAIKRFTRSITAPLGSDTVIVNHGITITTDIGSSTALIKDLNDNQNVLLYFTELARLNANRSRKGSESITASLMEAFDCPAVMQNKSMGNPIEAHYPFAGMLAAVQPEILATIMSDGDMTSGFANRLLFICGKPTAPIPSPPELDRLALMGVLRDLWSRRQSYAAGTGIRLSAESREIWDVWYRKDWYADADNAEEESLRQRHHVLIQKIALIYTICDGLNEVPAEHLGRAIQIVEWMWHNISLLTGMWGKSTDGQIEQRIHDVLALGPIKRRELQMKCKSRRWGSPEFNRVFDALKANGVIEVDPTGMVAIPGEKT